MATADWLAKADSTSRVSLLNPPGVLRRTTNAPTTRSPRSSGIASSDRQPASARTRRWGSSSVCCRSCTCTASRAPAALPTRVSSRWIRVARSVSTTSGLVP